MKVRKINEEFLKIYYRKKKIYYEKYGVYILLSDSYRIYKIKNDDCILDLTKFKKINLLDFLDRQDQDYIVGNITDNIIDGKIKLRKITTEDFDVYINDNYLKLFDNPIVKVRADNEPILVYENDEIVGLILPIENY